MSPAAPVGGAPGPMAGGAPVSEQELRQAIAMGEQIRAQIEGLEEQRAYLSSLTAEYTRGREALEGIQKATSGDEILLPIGGGTFVHARIDRTDTVISSIGSGVHMESSTEEAVRRIEERLQGVHSAAERVDSELNRLTRELSRLQASLSALGLG